MLVDPKIHFYKYPSQYFSSVFDIFLEARGSWLFSFGLLARGKSRFPFSRSKNVANANFFPNSLHNIPLKNFHTDRSIERFRGGTLEKIFEDAKEKKSGTDEEKFPVGPNCGRNKTTLCSFLGSYTSPLFLYDTFAIISPRKLQTAVNTHFRNFIVTVVVYH